MIENGLMAENAITSPSFQLVVHFVATTYALCRFTVDEAIACMMRHACVINIHAVGRVFQKSALRRLYMKCNGLLR